MESNKRFMTISEICEHTGFGVTKIRKLVRSPNNFTVKVGNKYFIDRQKFDKYIDNCIKHQIAIC